MMRHMFARLAKTECSSPMDLDYWQQLPPEALKQIIGEQAVFFIRHRIGLL
jgi:hypothetical protein